MATSLVYSSNVKILIIGDSCTDVFIYGAVNRLAPEAPVPVFVPDRETSNLGMAGNVYENIRSLGAHATLITNKDKITKKRYVYERTNQLLIRVDSDDRATRIQQNILHKIKNNTYDGEVYDAIIISDYNKGFLEYADIKYICDNNKNVFMDTKKQLTNDFINCSFIKINEHEYAATKYKLTEELLDKLIVTLSGKGCKYKDKLYPVEDVEVKDLSGAGDTFLSAFVWNYIMNRDIDKAIEFAQVCATKVVQKYGVAVI